MDGQQAFIEGKYRVEGDFNLFLKLAIIPTAEVAVALLDAVRRWRIRHSERPEGAKNLGFTAKRGDSSSLRSSE